MKNHFHFLPYTFTVSHCKFYLRQFSIIFSVCFTTPSHILLLSLCCWYSHKILRKTAEFTLYFLLFEKSFIETECTRKTQKTKTLILLFRRRTYGAENPDNSILTNFNMKATLELIQSSRKENRKKSEKIVEILCILLGHGASSYPSSETNILSQRFSPVISWKQVQRDFFSRKIR